MRAVIFGNGDIADYSRVLKYMSASDFIICADGGIRHAKALDIVPDILIGDFDSSKPEENAVKRIEYPSRKDFTDGELCVKYAVEHGYEEIVLMGMRGTRTDHTLTNMLLLSQCSCGMMIDDNNEIYYLKDRLSIKNKKGKTLSIIPVKGDMCGITTAGLDYPLDNETLYFGESRGNSNVVIADVCEIKVSSGEGFVIINDGE